MAITKTITANGSKGHHKFSLRVSEDSTSGNSSFISYAFTIAPIQSGWDWYGSNIPYTVSINGTNYTGNISSYNGSSTVTLKNGSNIEIPHNSDGTKTISISFTVTDTTGQSYTCGNASASDNMTLSRLHEPPDFGSVTFTEQNTVLTNIGIGNDYFVPYLSKKLVTINVTTHDSATIQKYEVINDSKIYTSTSNQILLDFTQNELYTIYSDTLQREVAKITIRVTDSLGGVLTVAYPYSYIIPYTKPFIEATSTSIKRKTDSQTTLIDNLANLNFVGTYYNSNNVVGNNNSYAVEYKIWNGTEPSSYINITSSASVDGNSVKVENYELSNLEYTKTYEYKIRITDSFSEPVEINGTLSTGVSVWTEYQDRVNFLKITIDNKNIEDTLSEILYEGSSTNNTITLSDDVDNYRMIVITFLTNSVYFTAICQAPFDKEEIATCWAGGGYIRGASFELSGVSLTFNWKRYGNFSNTGNETIAVTKVVGYK